MNTIYEQLEELFRVRQAANSANAKNIQDKVLGVALSMLHKFGVELEFVYLENFKHEHSWYKGKGWYYTPVGMEPVGVSETKELCIHDAFLELMPLYTAV